MPLQVGVRLAEVAPVAVDRHGVHVAALDQPREEMLAEVTEAAVVAVLGPVQLGAQLLPERVSSGSVR